MIKGSTVIQRNPRVVHRNLADEAGAVLLHLDTTAYHGVNDVGTTVWTLLENHCTFDELIDALHRCYEVPAPVLKDDIATFVQELKDRDLVLLSDPATSTDHP